MASAVSAGIINENNMIIFIFLHNYRFDIIEVPLLFIVIVTWNNNAERKFLLVRQCMVLLVIVVFLMLCNLSRFRKFYVFEFHHQYCVISLT